MSVPAIPTILGGVEVEFLDDGRWVQKRYRAAELPGVLARDLDVPRAESVIITQFCRDWRTWPEDREWMLEGEPDPAGDQYDLAKVAAVVRGLCERWDHPTPAWIEGVRAPTEILLSLDKVPLNPGYERSIRAVAPPACAKHGVYYEADMLEYKKDVFRRLRQKMRFGRDQDPTRNRFRGEGTVWSRSRPDGPGRRLVSGRLGCQRFGEEPGDFAAG